MNLDGTGLKNLTENTVDSRWPRWTPDGKWIAYTRTQDKNSDIYFISKDGKRLKPIITSPFRDEIAEIRP
jgi:TolB protein